MNIDSSEAKLFKSSRSTSGSDCVEVAHLADSVVAVRDAKNPTGPVLVLTPFEWDTFTASASSNWLLR